MSTVSLPFSRQKTSFALFCRENPSFSGTVAKSQTLFVKNLSIKVCMIVLKISGLNMVYLRIVGYEHKLIRPWANISYRMRRVTILAIK